MIEVNWIWIFLPTYKFSVILLFFLFFKTDIYIILELVNGKIIRPLPVPKIMYYYFSLISRIILIKKYRWLKWHINGIINW